MDGSKPRDKVGRAPGPRAPTRARLEARALYYLERFSTTGVHLRVLGESAGQIHHALPVTSTLCTAAATLLPGTLPHRHGRQLSAGAEDAEPTRRRQVRLEHPKGIVETTVELGPDSTIISAGMVRTARRLLDGIVYLRRSAT